MNKPSLWIGGVLVLLVLAAGTFYVLRHPFQSLQADSKVGTATTTEDDVTSAATPAIPKPTCTLQTDSKFYRTTGPVKFTWSSTNADSIFFDDETPGPDMSGRPALPTGKFAANGSKVIEHVSSGYNVVQIAAEGPGGVTYCQTIYFVGSGDLFNQPASSIFGDFPTTITFNSTRELITTSDGELAFAIGDAGSVGDGNGTIERGHIVLLVKDGSNMFPVFLVNGEPQKVILSSGAVVMKASLELPGGQSGFRITLNIQ